MKKFLFLIATIAISTIAFSQATLTNSADTLTNTDTETATSAKQNTVFDVITIQAIITKVSGTVSGTCLVQGSVDGTNYVDITTDTLTLSNVTTNTKIWTFEKTKYLYYRVRTATSGTMVVTQRALLLGRPYPR